jgi:hypothetical protein
VSPSHVLHEGLSVCGRLAIGGGQTVWNRIREDDTPAAAESLARICAHVLHAAPALVAGLAPDPS